MKQSIVIGLFLIFSSLYANDELGRLESVVQEIEQLRKDYDVSQKELQICRETLENKEKPATTKRNINNLENEIIYLKKILKTKEKEIKILKKQLSDKKCKNQIVVKKSLKKQTNTFPELEMRKKVNPVKKVSIVVTKPTTYRLKKESRIYDGVDGKVIATWEALTSFTSNKVSNNGWIMITGYFVERKWRKAQKEMWVHSSDALKRD